MKFTLDYRSELKVCLKLGKKKPTAEGEEILPGAIAKVAR